MARPTRDAIQAYMSITGAIEPVALQRLEVDFGFRPVIFVILEHFGYVDDLEEHGGNLAEAVNAHFREFENNTISPTSGASTRYNHQVRDGNSRQGGLPSLISAARGFRPSLLLDPSYRNNILQQIGGTVFAGRQSPGSHTGEVTGLPVDDYARPSTSHLSQIHGDTYRDHGSYQYDSNAEEEMIRAAIEASKKDFQEGSCDRRYSLNRDPSKVLSPEEVSQHEDEELARALSLSLQTEELEKAMHEQMADLKPYQVEGYHIRTSDMNVNGISKPGSSSLQHGHEDARQKQRNDSPYPKELGGIPLEELDRALMLEAELFSGMANDSSHNHLRGHHSEGQSSKNMEPERPSALRESLLPVEPSSENEDAITLLVRMPDSSRHGRRFLKSDKLKHLFHFIDSCGAVKTNTYKVVRPYPRHAFSQDDGGFTFEELGLTNKQEALFLELI